MLTLALTVNIKNREVLIGGREISILLRGVRVHPIEHFIKRATRFCVVNELLKQIKR